MMRKEEFYTTIKSWPLSGKEKQLIVNGDIIKYSSNNLLGSSFKVLVKSEIEGFRCGINWIWGLKFIIGREYQIFIRNHNKEEIAIYFKTFYGFRKKKLHQQYVSIMQALWDNFFNDITDSYIKRFFAGEDFELCNVWFSKEGLTIKAAGTFKEEKKFIPWNKVGTHIYASYFAIYSRDDAANINRGYNYHSDWNAYVLKGIVTYIKEHGKDPRSNN